jgi:hypothetical protein
LLHTCTTAFSRAPYTFYATLFFTPPTGYLWDIFAVHSSPRVICRFL